MAEFPPFLSAPPEVAMNDKSPLNSYGSRRIATSQTDPLQAPEIALPTGVKGHLLITFTPGKQGLAVLSDVVHERDLQLDLQRLTDLKTTVLVGFTEAEEMTDLLDVPIEHIQAAAEEMGLTYLHFPIRDVSAPSGLKAQHAAQTLAQQLADRIQSGDTVAVYCRGGRGRSGMMAAVILTRLGINPQEAIKRVRTARKGAIETRAQERFVETSNTIAK